MRPGIFWGMVKSASNKFRDFMGRGQEYLQQGQEFHKGQGQECLKQCQGFQGEKVRSATDEVRRFIRGKVMSASFRDRDFIGRGSGVPQPRSEISRGSQEFLRQGQKFF